MSANLYFNDVYVWSLVAHLAGLRVRASMAVCCLDYNVRQAWLPWHTSTLRVSEHALAAKFGLTFYAIHYISSGRGAWTKRNLALRRNVSVRERVPTQLDSQLLWSNVDRTSWTTDEWDSPEVGLPLAPRLAKCGCKPKSG